MEKMKFKTCTALSIFLVATALFLPGSLEGAEKGGTFSIYFENDLFAHTDQYYTNGTKISWVSPDLTDYAKSRKLPAWALPLVYKLPFINDPGLQRNVVLSLGQNMYTPKDISRKDLVVGDRPYAGWTYCGVAFQSKNERRLDSMEIQLGMIGPLSFAEQTQKFVHRLRGCQLPNGWDNQIKNEPGLAVVYERKWRLLRKPLLGRFGFDTITHLGGALGNVYTYANTGMEARLGWNIPLDFGASLIRPGGDTNAPANQRDPRFTHHEPFCLNLFACFDGRGVLRNMFLDGNTFTSSYSVDKKYFVADFVWGVSMILYGYKISLARALRTKEFKGQEDNQSFGSITLSHTW